MIGIIGLVRSPLFNGFEAFIFPNQLPWDFTFKQVQGWEIGLIKAEKIADHLATKSQGPSPQKKLLLPINNIVLHYPSTLYNMDAAVTFVARMPDLHKKNIADVVNAYSKRLMGFIRRRVSTDADAEDILQDVFYQFMGNTQPIEQLTAWLFRVARNRITDTKRKHRPELLDDIYEADEGFLGWAELFFDAKENPETEYLRGLFWETLNKALDELPAEQKKVFVLNELEDVPFKDIAAQTGASVNTLLSRKRYAVLHLRARLQVLKDELLNY